MSLWQTITKQLGFPSRRPIGHRGEQRLISGQYFSSQGRDVRRYADAIRNVPLVSAALRVYGNTCAQAKWSVIPAEEEGARAEEIAAIVEQLLFRSSEWSWQEAVRRAAMHKFFGFSVHEWTAYRRDDGIIAFSQIAPRSQSTLDRWQLSDSGEVEGVWQNQTLFLPRGKIVYMADNALNDRPEGLGLLKSVEEPLARLALYERLEKIGLGNDLRGIFIGRAPLAELQEKVSRGQMTKEEALASYEHIVNMASNLTRSPNQSAFLDSAVYSGEQADGSQRLINVPKQSIELLQGDSSSLPDANRMIERLNREIARGLGAEFLLLGEGSGSYALGREKTSQYSLMVDEGLRTMAEAFHRDLIRNLFRLNSWDMRYLPELQAEEAQFMATQEKINALVALNGLDATDPAVNELRAELGLPMIEADSQAEADEPESEDRNGEGEEQ